MRKRNSRRISRRSSKRKSRKRINTTRKMEKKKITPKTLHFKDFPEFKPNLTPKQVLQSGSFGGTYFRDIHSNVTKKNYKGKEVIKEFPKHWFNGLDIDTMITSQNYDKKLNKYGVKCGSSLEAWEGSGWIDKQDPYGWFQWYCRFYRGRRTDDDKRQIDRWLKLAGPKGRFKNRLLNMIKKKGVSKNDFTVSPVIRQVLLHWAYQV
tara:strand:- start:129 stop:749 length:621 start_codon:yes stop_codon:yes gene_type:complete